MSRDLHGPHSQAADDCAHNASNAVMITHNIMQPELSSKLACLSCIACLAPLFQVDAQFKHTYSIHSFIVHSFDFTWS